MYIHPELKHFGLFGVTIVLRNCVAFPAGVYTGYNTLSIALTLPDDGVLVACDISEEYANVGKPFWKEVPLRSV